MTTQRRKFPVAYFFALAVVVSLSAFDAETAFSVESVPARPSLEEIQRNRFQFLQDQWKAYWRSLTQVKATWTYRQTQGTTVKEHEAEFEAYYPYVADVRKSVRGETVSVVGPRYSFELLRENADAPWTIDELLLDPSPQVSIQDWKFPTPYERLTKNKRVGQNVFHTLSVGLQTGCAISLPALFALDGLELRKLEYATLDGEEFLYADVGFLRQEDAYRIDGEVWLDAENFLVAKAFFRETLDSQEITSNITCRYEVVSGIPFPKLYQNESGFKDDAYNERLTVEIEFHSFQKLEDVETKDFTLSRFGLPEPDFGEKPANRLRVIVIVAGLLLIGFGARRIYRKRDQK